MTRELNADLVGGDVRHCDGRLHHALDLDSKRSVDDPFGRFVAGLDLTAVSIGRITDRGAATNDIVSSAGNITAIAALSMSGTRIDAGDPTLDANGLPTAFPMSSTSVP